MSLALLFPLGCAAADRPLAETTGKPRRSISTEDFEDKVRGGWAGQMIGVTYGAPTEFRWQQRIVDIDRQWKPEEIKGALDQDDLYVEMTFAGVMDQVGLGATTEQYGEAFRDSKYGLAHANFASRRLLRHGIKAPMSGNPADNMHANDIDFQIESDFIGLMCPGMPQAGSRFADRVGHVMNYGDGVYGGVFFSAMYSTAFFEKDPRRVVEAGLAALPRESVYAQVIRDVLRWSAENPDWKKTWQLIEDKWDKDDPCPDGALLPFNIDATINGAYVALGLLYGKGNFDKTLEVSMRSGQDSDCNPSSAAGILGVMLGLKNIPEKWKSRLAAIADEKFSYTDYSFNSIVRSTIDRAKLVVKQEGGSADEKALLIPVQTPIPAKFEQYAPGKAVERIAAADARWTWKGPWEKKSDKWRTEMRAKAAGAEATVSFEGTGAMLVGSLDGDRGTAEIFLDGKSVAKADAYNDDGNRGGEGLWGKFDISPGAHTLRVVVDGKPYTGSKDAWIYLQDLIVYRR